MGEDFCNYDVSGRIGDLFSNLEPPEWPMYSYSRPSSIVWNTIARALKAAGWEDEQIKTWLQSKHPRWALNDGLGDALEAAARVYAAEVIAAGPLKR